jgi:hypothetical protein
MFFLQAGCQSKGPGIWGVIQSLSNAPLDRQLADDWPLIAKCALFRPIEFSIFQKWHIPGVSLRRGCRCREFLALRLMT